MRKKTEDPGPGCLLCRFRSDPPTIRFGLRIGLLLILVLSGCASPAYYYQAASGHLSLMRSRQDIDEYLAKAPGDDQLAARLETAQSILEYADQSLDLPPGDSYSSYAATSDGAVTWNLVAAPEFSLQPKQWCFLVAGCVPYKGYFDENKARKSAARLEDDAMDVAVTPASAYSTLGWFDDPILDTMLEQSDAGLAAILFHELAHQKLYVKGDARFNESYASFVERQGVSRWLSDLDATEEMQRWRSVQQARADFRELLAETRTELQGLYASGVEDSTMREAKLAIYARLASDYRALVESNWQGMDLFSSFFEIPPNNADLALVSTYQSGGCAFQRLFDEVDGDFAAFHQRAAAVGDRDALSRQEWLDQPC
jgi:predicted aminopeptidase